ncbi:hypothetical protein PI124_g15735 [Phytophthora idaei]|nr:hypothetical protein PI125_g15871 [Phytophthora idaei]KAG3143165.1 hypothetical protein PI126_g14756 [Phytophthora idaei]KAG3239318.1 hypothetical protein PI124_g15735 [Phytophthora idaei]
MVGGMGVSLFNDSTAYESGMYIGERYPGIPKIIGGDINCRWARNLKTASISYSANPVVDPPTLIGTIEDTTHPLGEHALRSEGW